MPRVISRSVRQKLRKPILKPISWFGAPDVLNQIFDTLLPVMGNKRNHCWQWLETTKPEVEGLPVLTDIPIAILDAKEDAKNVLLHAQAYADYLKSKNK